MSNVYCLAMHSMCCQSTLCTIAVFIHSYSVYNKQLKLFKVLEQTKDEHAREREREGNCEIERCDAINHLLMGSFRVHRTHDYILSSIAIILM